MIQADATAKTFLLVSGDFVRTGGMDMANYFLAIFLAEQDFDVRIVSHNVDAALVDYPNVTWHRVSRPGGSNLLGEPLLRLRAKQVARRYASGERSLRCVVNGGNCPLPDVNWVHYLHAATGTPAQGSVARRMKSRLAHLQFLRMEEKAIKCARVIIANSDRTKLDIVGCYGIDEAKIHTVYYGTDPARFYPAEQKERRDLRKSLGLPLDKYFIVFIGALGDRRKGFDTLFAAWKQVRLEAEKAELLVIGAGAELRRWQSEAGKLEEGGRIRFLGFRKDVPEILRASDAFVAPTRYEAFGLAVQEALCCGLPAIVSRDAGVTERYRSLSHDLLLEDPEDVAGLASVLRTLVAKRESLAESTRAVGESLRERTWHDMAAEILSKIEE